MTFNLTQELTTMQPPPLGLIFIILCVLLLAASSVIQILERLVKLIWHKNHEKECIWYGRRSLPCSCPREPVAGCVPFMASEDVDILSMQTEPRREKKTE